MTIKLDDNSQFAHNPFMASNQLCVMDAIRARRGLCTKLSHLLKVDRRIIWQWHRVPLRHALKVSRITDIPLTIIKGEHARNWPIPLIELARRAGYIIGKETEPAKQPQPIEFPLISRSIQQELEKLHG